MGKLRKKIRDKNSKKPKKEVNSNNILPRWENYKERMVAFVDVLGFDQKVRDIKSEKDFNRVSQLVAILRSMEKKYQISYSNLIRALEITNFSDSIIFSMPYTDPLCAMALIIWICGRQYELIAGGSETLIRGYMTKGPVYHKNGIIFGKGYNDAYQNERKCGYAPRIVIDSKIIQEGQSQVINYHGEEPQDHIFNYLIEDASDGSYFIDYLKPIWAGLLNWSNEKLVLERTEVKRVIDKNLKLYLEKPKIYKKYKWLENYFIYSEKYFNDLDNFHSQYMPTVTWLDRKIIPNQIPKIINPEFL